MHAANKSWLRGSLLAGIYMLGALGILASGGGGGDNGEDTTQVNVPPVVADLADISLFGSLDQPFSADRYDYTATVDYSFRVIQITPVTADQNATVTVNGETVRSGFASSPIEHFPGVNSPILIIVTSGDKQYTKTYRLVVTIDASNDADLASLSLSAGALVPNFDPATSHYLVSVAFPASEAQVTAETNHPDATKMVNGLSVGSGQASNPIALAVGDNTITVEVTAENPLFQKAYTITVNRAVGDDNANLSGLAISVGVLDRIFQPDVFNYTASVSYTDTEVQVTATSESALATIRVRNILVTSGVTGQPVSLGEGSNLILVTVQAETGRVQNYSVLIERQSTNLFLQRAYMKASIAFAYSEFGGSLALGGDTLVVAERRNVYGDGGGVYVLIRDGSGQWSQQAYLRASNGQEGDHFGASLALSGDTLAIGAFLEGSGATGVNGEESDNSADYSGAAYVFTRDGSGQWSQQAYLKASNTDAGDRFGSSISLSGDTLAIGAPLEASNATGVNGDESNNFAYDSGSVYVFSRDGSGQWAQQAYLKASNTGSGDRFGQSVSLSGDTLAIAAPLEASNATGVNGNESNNLAPAAGAVYVFSRDVSGQWSKQAYLKASNSEPYDRFGQSLSLFGGTLAIGAYFEDSGAAGINGDESDNSASNSGAGYVFTRDGSGQWSQQAYLKASNAEVGDTFGSSLALFGDLMAIGASGEDGSSTGVNGDESNNFASNSGAVYLFARDGTGQWSQQAYLKASNTETRDYFSKGGDIFSGEIWSIALSLSADTLVVGAPDEDSNSIGVNGNQADNSETSSGAVYVYR